MSQKSTTANRQTKYKVQIRLVGSTKSHLPASSGQHKEEEFVDEQKQHGEYQSKTIWRSSEELMEAKKEQDACKCKTGKEYRPLVQQKSEQTLNKTSSKMIDKDETPITPIDLKYPAKIKQEFRQSDPSSRFFHKKKSIFSSSDTETSYSIKDVTYSQLLLKIPEKVAKAESKKKLSTSMELLFAPKKYGDHCNGFTSDSLTTLSTQKSKCQDNIAKKPVTRIKETVLPKLLDRPSAAFAKKNYNVQKVNSKLFSYSNWIFPVAKEIKNLECIKKPERSSQLSTKSNQMDSVELQQTKKYLPDDSQEMSDSQHKPSTKQQHFHGPEWKVPCKHSFVAGVPRPYIGTCPPGIEKLAKFSKGRQKFFLTQDPRKTYCLTNPEVLRAKQFSEKKEQKVLTELVKDAENVCSEASSEKSGSRICDEIDLDNPLDLDLQGLNYWKTFENDEQNFLNQNTYLRVRRVMDRAKCKTKMEQVFKEEQAAALISIPEFFYVEDRNTIIKTPTPEPSPRYAKLYRTEQKPHNVEKKNQEIKEREERYKDAIERTHEKEIALENERKKVAAKAKERLVVTLAEEHFEKAKENVLETTKSSIPEKSIKKVQTKTQQTYPHTMREMKHFHRQMKKTNRIDKATAIIKRDFYKERLDKNKYYPAAELEISEDSSQISDELTLSEQSSDDQDDIEVGKFNGKFRLRGFHYKMGNNIRGKIDKVKSQEKGCITREEWLYKLHPPKRIVKPDIMSGIDKYKDANAKNCHLFYPKFDYQPIKAKKSAIREYINKKLGKQYLHILRKTIRNVHPQPRFNVKKFNLIHFLQGTYKQRSSTRKSSKSDNYRQKQKMLATIDYILEEEKQKNYGKMTKKKDRMILLGIPCLEKPEKPILMRLCGGETRVQDTDWAPPMESLNPELEKQQRIEGGKIPLRNRWNMPASKFRRSTLRRNPRNPRNYSLKRVPSINFNMAVKTGKIPYIGSLDHDALIYENLHLPKRPYTQKFQTRRHHDHWNPTQDKHVDVHYMPILAEPKIDEMDKKVEKITLKRFQKAHPACSQYIDMDLTLPNFDYNNIIENFFKNSETTEESHAKKIKDICDQSDIMYHSLDPYYWNNNNATFPEREKYLSFLNLIRTTLNEEKKLEEGDTFHETKLLVDKDAMIESLQEDLKSIESCLMSESSSEGSNLSNDSGSIIVLNDKWKLPLDYVRKPDIPFEPLDRSRLKAEQIDVYKEYDNPFTVLPFSGQKRAQKKLIFAADGFNTFSTRQNIGKRVRLEVPKEDIKTKLVGPSKNKKFPARVITDVEKNYVDDLSHKPVLNTVNFKTGATFIKDALRLKFETMVIQGQLVRKKIYDRLNDENWDKALKTKLLYEKLFQKWEKTEYEHSMAVVHQVKSYYETTDILRKEHREVARELLLLNMDIVFIEGHWIRCIMLQNFHYLLGDQDWRYQNDWIHRLPGQDDEDVQLESYDVSIANRSTANVRVREKDDAWAIKTFYEEVYERNPHPILIVFPNADSFLKGVENLKTNTFVLLLELHYTLAINTELQDRLQSFESWCKKELKEKQDYVERKCSKKYFMEDRAADLKRRVHDFLNKPIEETFADESFCIDRAVIRECWHYMIPESSRGSTHTEPKPINMVGMISENVLDTVSKFEDTQIERVREIEIMVRKQHARELKISRIAYLTEKRIETEMKKVRRNLEPPFVKPKRFGRYKRQHLCVRKKPPPEKEKPLSQHARFYYRAFHEESDEMNVEEARQNITVVEKIQQHIVPFYFDHFLKLKDYSPNYNFKTQVELRDGPEINFLHHKNLLPSIMEKMKAWESTRNRIMEDNISRNPQMYENIK